MARTGCGPSVAARTNLGNCKFGKLTLRKIPLGSCHLNKSLWESTLHLSRVAVIVGFITVHFNFWYDKEWMR